MQSHTWLLRTQCRQCLSFQKDLDQGLYNYFHKHDHCIMVYYHPMLFAPQTFRVGMTDFRLSSANSFFMFHFSPNKMFWKTKSILHSQFVSVSLEIEDLQNQRGPWDCQELIQRKSQKINPLSQSYYYFIYLGSSDRVNLTLPHK